MSLRTIFADPPPTVVAGSLKWEHDDLTIKVYVGFIHCREGATNFAWIENLTVSIEAMDDRRPTPEEDAELEVEFLEEVDRGDALYRKLLDMVQP